MTDNHDAMFERMMEVERAIRDKTPTGDPVIDRLLDTVPRPDESRRAALEARLIARLFAEYEGDEPMIEPVDPNKRKIRPPAPRRRLLVRAAAATTMLVVGGFAVIGVLNYFGWANFSYPYYGAASYGEAFVTPDPFDLVLTATAIIAESTHIAEMRASGIMDDELTATALIQEVTQQFIAQTRTAEYIFGTEAWPSSATPTPAPPIIAATATAQPNTLRIPISRLVAYDAGRGPSGLALGGRLVLMTELRATRYSGAREPGETVDLGSAETPIIAASARITAFPEGERIDADSTLEVQVDPAEYAVLDWFVNSTSMQLLYIASR